MNVVKIANRPNGIGQKVASVSIPKEMAQKLPEDATHMTVEWRDGGIFYMPFAVVNSPRAEKLLDAMEASDGE